MRLNMRLNRFTVSAFILAVILPLLMVLGLEWYFFQPMFPKMTFFWGGMMPSVLAVMMVDKLIIQKKIKDGFKMNSFFIVTSAMPIIGALFALLFIWCCVAEMITGSDGSTRGSVSLKFPIQERFHLDPPDPSRN